MHDGANNATTIRIWWRWWWQWWWRRFGDGPVEMCNGACSSKPTQLLLHQPVFLHRATSNQFLPPRPPHKPLSHCSTGSPFLHCAAFCHRLGCFVPTYFCHHALCHASHSSAVKMIMMLTRVVMIQWRSCWECKLAILRLPFFLHIAMNQKTTISNFINAS